MINNNGYTINFKEYAGFLYAFVSGEEDSFDISKAYWETVIDECHKRQYKKLLVEENFKNELGTLEVFKLSQEFANMPIRGLRIAFIDQIENQKEINRFGETVAVNRGVQVRIFANRKQAEEWLNLT